VKRSLRILPFLVLLSLSSFGLPETRIRSVTEAYWTTRDFTRIPEYFTGKEYQGNQVIVRTQNARAGLYFVLELNEALETLPKSCEIFIEVVRSDGPEAKLYKLTMPDETKGRREVLLGITGEDWNSRKIKPVAWRIEIKDAIGKVIASKQSFLWGHEK
jgi:hypothetical protein